MRNTALFRWIFYGHPWIALAATALSWLSLRLAFGPEDQPGEARALALVFFATLAVYTLHRYLSFQRARGLTTAKRYALVAGAPRLSLGVGAVSLVAAAFLGVGSLPVIWRDLLWALPVTVFYLIPPLPGWRRLRDLPYLKVVWVGLAWAIVTVTVPVRVVGAEIAADALVNWPGINFLIAPGSPAGPFYREYGVRFLFTVAVALLFDLRDVALDRSQGVLTVANDRPRLHRLVTFLTLSLCAGISLTYSLDYGTPRWLSGSLAAAYLLMLPVAYRTYAKQSEDWYAVVVNGLLFLPPGAAAGALLFS